MVRNGRFVPLAALVLLLTLGAVHPAAAQPCTASGSWVNNPKLPNQIPAGTGTCPFFVFAWQELLALTQPSGRATGQLVFETYMAVDGLLPANGRSPLPWGKSPWPLILGGITKQAGSEYDLIAQTGNDVEVQFDVAVNRPMYEYVTRNKLYNSNCFNAGGDDILLPPSSNVPPSPNEAISLKTAWLPMAPCDPARYHCINAKVNGQSQTVALIGIHIVQKLPNHEEWIWSTFEHVANAPQCTPVSELPRGYDNWNFFNKSFVEAGQDCTPCPDPTNPTSCDYTTQCNVFLNENAKPNVCRVVDVLDDVESLNESVWSLLPRGSVWRNYMLVGTVWFSPGMTSSTDTSSQTQAGSTGVSNSVMETYTQNYPGGVNNCFSCHLSSFTAYPNGTANFSHVFGRIQQTTQINCPTLTQSSHASKAVTPAASH
jgi:hypothetical protein